MAHIRRMINIPRVAQVTAAAVAAGAATHALDHARGINGPGVFVLSCLAATAGGS